MKRGTLRQVMRHRQLLFDQAMRNFVECLRKETEAGETVRAIETAITRETEKAGDLEGTDAEVETFGRWLRSARSDLEAARAAFDRLQAETACARAVLSGAQTASEAAQQLEVKQTATARLQEQRREQHILDDMVRRR